MKTFKIAIDINAPQSQVWDAFFDLKNYGSWNPTIPIGLGKLEVNEMLELTWQRPKRQILFHPKILAIELGRKMSFTTYVIHPKLTKMVHHFVLESINENTTKFTQSWECNGLLIGLLWSSILPGFKEFKNMNEALKQYLEM